MSRNNQIRMRDLLFASCSGCGLMVLISCCGTAAFQEKILASRIGAPLRFGLAIATFFCGSVLTILPEARLELLNVRLVCGAIAAEDMAIDVQERSSLRLTLQIVLDLCYIFIGFQSFSFTSFISVLRLMARHSEGRATPAYVSLIRLLDSTPGLAPFQHIGELFKGEGR